MYAPVLFDVQIADVLARFGVALQDREAVEADLLDLLPAVLGGLAVLPRCRTSES